jgi:mRNA interferase RelE/StbE
MIALRFHPKALKELKDLPPKHYKQVVSKIFSLLEDQTPNDARPLKALEDKLFRVSSGEYRIVYRFDEENLYIEAVGARNDDEVYKTISRRF